jgi:hypothetical protein
VPLRVLRGLIFPYNPDRFKKRSFSQQAIVALAKGLDMEENPKKRRAALLKSIMDDPVVLNSQDVASPVDLIRKDRQR